MLPKDQKLEAPPEIFSQGQKNHWSSLEASIWMLKSGVPEEDVTRSLARTLFDQPRRIEPRFLYDERGSRLFEKICTLPEYYLTRTENAILEKEAKQIIALADVECMVELGAGFSKKTVHLLSQQAEQRGGGTFAPVDVSLTALVGSRDSVKQRFPQLEFHGLCACYEEGILSIERSLPTLFAFLGSSVGNLDRSDFDRFFQLLSGCMGPDDFFLIGVDCTKEEAILKKAYNDSEGITAEFILNAFENINRLMGSDFDQRRMRYDFCYNLQWQQMEMYAVSTSDQKIDLPLLESGFLWKEGEKILVEISRKFEPHRLQQQFEYFGLESIAHLNDPQKWFSLLLFRCRSDRP
jgi:dimethylhistidine N-methyltransferase